MGDRPFVELNIAELVTDTLGLSAEDIGVYVLLLAASWNSDGVLPPDDQARARIARVSVVRWRRIWPRLEPYFFVDDGRVTSLHVKKWFSKASVIGRSKLPASIRVDVFDRDGERCRYCGDTDGPFHIDHVIPVARGGSDHPDNLVIACVPCNLSKGAKTLEEWRQ